MKPANKVFSVTILLATNFHFFEDRIFVEKVPLSKNPAGADTCLKLSRMTKLKCYLYNIEHGRLSLNGFIEVGIPTTRGSSLWYCSVYCFNSWTAWDTLKKNFISRYEKYYSGRSDFSSNWISYIPRNFDVRPFLQVLFSMVQNTYNEDRDDL